jgi:hypothetical protein
LVDKARRTAPLAITCADGEQPTAAKVTAINNQLRAATNILERAVGDLWNQSGDSLLYTYHLQIPNLARQLGENRYLSPCLFPVDEDFVYVDNIGSKFDNQNDIYLQFKPKAGTSITIVTDASSVLSNSQTNRYDVDASGDYWVDITTGRLISFDELASDIVVSYTVDSTEWNIRTDTLPGVIPDPRQADFTSCRISQPGGAGTTFYIHLPPRCPLTDTFAHDFDGGAFDGWSLPDRYPPSGDLSDNYDDTVGATGGKHLWQNPTYAALNDNFYRYSLPKEMRDQLSTMTTSDSLPLGFLLLWDISTGTIIADAVFRRGPDATQEWVFEIESDTVNFSNDVTTTEDEVSYNGTGYVVIACGSPVARSFWTLNNALINHTHGNDGDFTSPMEHSKLINLNPPPSDYTGDGHDSRYPTDVPPWSPSRWEMDEHTSLLSRAGSQGVAGGRNRDANDNAMLGDLVMASTSGSAGVFLNITADSNRIYFGSIASGPYLHFDQSNNCIAALHQDTAQIGFRGISTSGAGLYGESASGYGVHGASTSSYGVRGISTSSHGVYGYTAGALSGVLGYSAGTGNGVYGYNNGASGYGVLGVSTGVNSIGICARHSGDGYALIAEADTIDPVRAAFRLIPQDKNPTSPQEGDLYVNSTTNNIFCYLGGAYKQLD